MDVKNGRGCNQSDEDHENNMDLRRGPWTVEEDYTLMNYIAHHGEGRWNSLSRAAGLKRTGKSCRLRWLNYLRPDVRRGNITLEEQLLILELHSRWGNRWSKIAQQLPGRTDNEIKNYWRTRVQKHAKQLKCDVNSKQFKDAMRYLWMPRLVERIQAAAAASSGPSTVTDTKNTTYDFDQFSHHTTNMNICNSASQDQLLMPTQANIVGNFSGQINTSFTADNSSMAASSDSFGAQVSPVSDITDSYNYSTVPVNQQNHSLYHLSHDQADPLGYEYSFGSGSNPYHVNYEFQGTMQQNNNQTMYDADDEYLSENSLNAEDYWYLQQLLNKNSV